MHATAGRLPVRLAGLVVARNEAGQLGACLASLAGVDELVVVDDGSTDATAEVARRAGARVLAGAGDLGTLRELGRAATSCAWIVALDADERLPAGGVARLRAALAAAAPDVAALRLPIRSHLGARFLRHGGYYPAARVRVVRRDAARWPSTRVHERPRLTGRVATLPLPIEHFGYRDLAHAREKIRRYAAWAAVERRQSGRRPLLADTLFRVAWRWLRVYLLRGGVLMGRDGWHLAALQARGIWWRDRWIRRGPPAGAGDRP